MEKSRILTIILILGCALQSFGNVHRYMIFFQDKAGSSYSIDRPEEFLSDRALERRNNQHIPVAINDLPVSPQYVDQLRSSYQVDVFFATKWMNGVLAELDESLLEEIEALDFVKEVEFVAPGSKLSGDTSNGGRTASMFSRSGEESDSYESSEQNEFIGVDFMHHKGYKGEGKLIAVFDSGFDEVDASSYFAHLFENDQVVAGKDFIRGSSNVYQYDSHGTKVLSCISAYKEGVYSGTAPGSDVVLCVTEDVSSEYRIEEYNWLFAAEFADSIGVDIINSSVGYSYFDDDRMDYVYEDLDGNSTVITNSADLAASKGILVVSSNGNEGNSFWTYMNAPADADSVFAIGAATFDKKKASFSSFGPTSDGRVKPDVSALGFLATVVVGDQISYSNGTSFSSPMVAGLAAGLWQAFPNLSNMEVIEYLKMTAHQSDSPDTLLGYGIPDFVAAFNKIRINEGEIVSKYVAFPNPVDNRRIVSFYVDSLSENINSQISFYDLKGSFIYSEEFFTKHLADPVQIDVSTLLPGSYILTVTNERIKKKIKLVVL